MKVFKTNTAVSNISAYYDVVEETRRAIETNPDITNQEKSLITTYGFGHMADGDIHINICVEGHHNSELSQRLNSFVDPFVMQYIKRKQGSISGEHGVGQ